MCFNEVSMKMKHKNTLFFLIIIALLAVVFVIFFALRFHGSADQYSGQRPCDYPNTHWESKEIDAYFDVVKSDNNDNYYCIGKLIDLNGETIEIDIKFDTGRGVEIWNGYSNRLLQGEVPVILTFAQFYSDKLTITNITEDKLFNHKYDKITFVRRN